MRLRLVRASTFAATVLTAALASSSAGAHHSFSAEFDIGRPIEVTGTVTKVEWTNPHAWIHLETEANGKREQWAVEMLGINALVRSGISPATVKAGDRLTIAGYGARNGTNTANASSVKRADTGETLWSGGNSSD